MPGLQQEQAAPLERQPEDAAGKGAPKAEAFQVGRRGAEEEEEGMREKNIQDFPNRQPFFLPGVLRKQIVELCYHCRRPACAISGEKLRVCGRVCGP